MSRSLRAVQSYGRVVLLLDGAAIADLPWEAAADVAKAIGTVAKHAEEWAKAEAIARDQATLLRAGFPVGLTSHPVIQGEAANLAAHDRDLRRYMPGGIRSQEQFGAPTIVRHDP